MRRALGSVVRIGNLALGVTLGFLAMPAGAADSPPAASPATAEILHQLRTFATTGRVLHVGAHPDDENTQLIAYLSRGRGYDTAYLSITRGDGGQNLLGPEFDEKLGVARTQELLAARRVDGGRQFFTRAIDFGFSKNPEETLRFWNHDQVLGDVVRIYRKFRPDVVVTRFPIPPGSGGHGHHIASAILAVEAFKLAGDPAAYPEQLKEGLTPWQPKRIVWNTTNFARGGGLENNPGVKLDIGGTDAVTGDPYSSIAGRSRSMHRTQAFGEFSGGASAAPRMETMVLLGGEPAQQDLMDGVDTSWGRVPGASGLQHAVDQVAAEFKRDNPGASVPALLEIRRQLSRLADSVIVAEKRAQLDRLIRKCLGLVVTSTTETATVVQGHSFRVNAKVQLRPGSPVPVRWLDTTQGKSRITTDVDLSAKDSVEKELNFSLPKSATVTQPYWLREPPETGFYRVEDSTLIGTPESPPDLPLVYHVRIGDQEFAIDDELYAPGAKGAQSQGVKTTERGLKAVIIPPVALGFESGAAVFRPGATTVVKLSIKAGQPTARGRAELTVPKGWKVSAPQDFSIGSLFGKAELAFQVTAPNSTEATTITAQAVVDGITCRTDEFSIQYPHIPTQLLQPTVRKKVVSVLVGTKGHEVAYLPGSGDDVPQALTQLGYRVTTLSPADVTLEKLQGFDAVVVGVRALNARPELAPRLPALFSYAEAGGTVVFQYNWTRALKIEAIAPYRLKLSDLRVTDETAPVTLLAPEHPVLTTPNAITAADFEGWVQERGVYFPSEWDEHFVPILAMNDPGEPPLKGALLVARHGKGYFVYTSLAFFRQLPAGVPGAYRLFANLISLGK